MSSGQPPDGHGHGTPRRQSIPLRELGRDEASRGDSSRNLEPVRRSASPGHPPTMSSYWDQPYDARSDGGHSDVSSIDPAALSFAMPPDFRDEPLDGRRDEPMRYQAPYAEDSPIGDYPDADNDTVPLTAQAQPISGGLIPSNNDPQGRDSFQTVSDIGISPSRGRDTLHPDTDLEHGRRGRRQNFGMSLMPQNVRTSRSSSPSGALQRAGSVVRAMSQRVVNISGDAEIAEQRASRHRSRSPAASDRDHPRSRSNSVFARDRSGSVFADTAYHSPAAQANIEKTNGQAYLSDETPSPETRLPPPNPLKGRTLNIFSSGSRVRNWFCNVLVNAYTEPLILVLIVLQTIFLTIESAPNVFKDGGGRPSRWGQQWTDWALLALFLVFTFELIARIIVSGFILNAAEYSTIDRSRGIRVAVANQYKAVFQPQQHKAMKANSMQFPPEPSAIARSFTTLMQGQQALPETLEDQQRYQLARRAFLRHSFNRLDFVAVVSFWISFVMGISGVETQHHVYVFKMLSCLRILRLLALTHGTAIILRSLKKAAPLLVRVAFLIVFFWVLFAIIGVQSFKSSLSRQCVWLDPLAPNDLDASYTNEEQFCGGHRNNNTGDIEPWVQMIVPGSLDELRNGTNKGKGFICPRGSLCLEQESPYNDTVNFDNIIHSLELVFVIMSANTFTDLMYNTMGSDYSMAALFFGGGIMILTLWLVNLLIAVITSSFQVIREESKASAFTTDHHRSFTPDPEEEYRRAPPLQRVYHKTRFFWVVVIAFGLLCQSFRSSTMSSNREEFIDIAEIVVTVVLDVDMVLRILANWRGFHRSRRNLFDLFLAVVTSIILLPPIREHRAYQWLSVFQILRVYRVVMAIPITRKLIMLVLGNAGGIANLMMFVFLMTFLMAILAAQLFRGEIPVYEDGELNPVSFYTVYNSFLGMYQILTSENWTGILYAVTSYTTGYHTSWIGAAFLIGWFILSFFILINMFIAVIQENFDISEDEKRLEQVKAFLQRKELGSSSSNLALSTIFTFGKHRQKRDPLDYGPAMTEMLLKDAVVREFLDEPGQNEQEQETPQGPTRATTNLLGDIKPGILSKVWGKIVRKVTQQEPNPFYSNIDFNKMKETLDARQMAQQAVSASSERRKAQREYLAKHPKYNISLYIFKPNNKIRRLCQKLVGPARGSERFDGVDPNKLAWYSFSAFIYAAIVAMVIIACITTPLYQKQLKEKSTDDDLNWYVWTDLGFAVLFSAESVIKVIADGLVATPNAYLRSSWGIVDAVVLITLWINVGTLIVNDGTISRAIGAFKAFRALRLLNVSNSARDTFHSLIIVGWWKIFGAAFISISLLIPFAIYGLNLFHSLLESCNDGDGITTLNQCFGEFNNVPFSDDWPMLAPRVASNPARNFDDFASALFTLFQIVSQEGWTDTSFGAQAITGLGNQPQDLASEGNAIFFVAFNLLATVFVLTLFISVFMRNYTEQTGVAYLTAEQRSWLELRKLLRHISPSKSSYDRSGAKKWKRWCHKRAIEKRGKWHQGITVVLVLHLILLVAEYKGEPEWWSMTRTFVFLVCILLYLANIFVRIAGLGWSRFRRSSWDLYSLACVAGSFVSTVALISRPFPHETLMQVHKYFLVSVLLLIIPRNDALDQLFKTAAASLPVIGNLLTTWLVLFLVFAIAFTQAFSLTRFGEEAASDINFRTVPKALILLFRMSFGEGWNDVMEDYAGIEPPFCVEEIDFFHSDCGSKPWARFLFVSWNLLSMYIFVNLFVSLIYESFSYVYQRSSWVAAVDRDEIRRFKEAWRSVDPNGTGAISKETFPRLLGELSGVFQMRIYDPEDSVHNIMEDVRGDVKTARHMSIATTSNMTEELDVVKLNQRLAKLDVAKIRERRRLFNIFYEEVLVSADPDRGITFTSVLMILAHYNIINDSKSLKLDEFLRRRARLQRVDDSVRRKTVQGFFDTLYWSRRFKKHMQSKYSARMTAVPQLDIPDIFVDDDAGDGKTTRASSRRPSIQASPAHLSVDTNFGQRNSSGSDGIWHSGANHPLSLPRSTTSTPSPPGTPSGFGFELLEAQNQSGELSRRSSAVSPTQARNMLEDTVWLDSIRRSTTTRRSDRGSGHRYGNLG